MANVALPFPSAQRRVEPAQGTGGLLAPPPSFLRTSGGRDQRLLRLLSRARHTEEIEAAEKEAEIYISGNVTLLIDDPGRQQIGSFNPLTEDDWTDMAYVGNTARLCHSIVDSDVEEVLDWLSQPDADANQRDHTGAPSISQSCALRLKSSSASLTTARGLLLAWRMERQLSTSQRSEDLKSSSC